MIDVLFPDWRFVVRLIAATFLLTLFLLASDGADAMLLGTTAVSAFWARDCLRRLRRWEAGTLVPGYSLTALVLAVGIVGTVAILATAISYLAGDLTPAFGMATMVGFIVVVGLTYAQQLSAIRRALPIIGYVAAAVIVARLQFGGPVGWPEMAHPLIQWSALAVAAIAIVLLKTQLDRPARQGLENPAMPWDSFRPFVAGPMDVFGGWMARNRFSEGILVVAPFIVTLNVYDPNDSLPSLLTVLVFYAIYIGSLTPILLLKGAGRWLSTAWQLGAADSRADIGRMFVSRIVVANLATLALVLVAVGAHALFCPTETLWTGHRDLLDETMFIYAVGFAAFPWACFIHPPRTTGTPTQIGTITVVCVAYLIVFHAAPAFQAAGRAVLLLLLLASGAFAVYVGGRAIARIDFLPTTED